MRISELYISNYKNLRDFNLSFDGQNFLDIFVGKNGTGKSNLFEALIAIFQHLNEFRRSDGYVPPYDYKIKYQTREENEVKIEWISGQLKVNNKERKKTLGNIEFPENILVYYSGHNETVSSLLKEYRNKFRRNIKGANISSSPFFLGINSEYKDLLLMISLIQSESNKTREFIFSKLGIKEIGDEIMLILKRPQYAQGKSQYNVLKGERDYWGAKGIVENFLKSLENCQSQNNTIRDEGFFADRDIYIYFLSISKLNEEFQKLNSQELFRQFDNLKTLDMLQKISLPITLLDDTEASTDSFSDGQFQSVYIYSIIELFKDSECIALLDEPDAFLHPVWQYEFLTQISEITEKQSKNSHILMTSHSAMTLCNFQEERINLFKVQENKIQCYPKSKKEIVYELSNDFIRYSEDESILRIDNVIRTSDRPILFVEGVSDVLILETAYKKLYGEDIPVLIQDAYDHGFIKVLLSRNDTFNNYPDKIIYALFDFDDAYNKSWNELDGNRIVDDINQGLCKQLNIKLKQKNNIAPKKAYVFLLPIPENALKKQVWNEQDPINKIVNNPCFTIEHIFYYYGNSAFQSLWFTQDEKTQNIQFKNDKKVKFASNIVPNLDQQYFEPFRPMFDMIRSHLVTSQEN